MTSELRPGFEARHMMGRYSGCTHTSVEFQTMQPVLRTCRMQHCARSHQLLRHARKHCRRPRTQNLGTPVADFVRGGLADAVQWEGAARQRADVQDHAIQLRLVYIVPGERRVPATYTMCSNLTMRSSMRPHLPLLRVTCRCAAWLPRCHAHQSRNIVHIVSAHHRVWLVGLEDIALVQATAAGLARQGSGPVRAHAHVTGAHPSSASSGMEVGGLQEYRLRSIGPPLCSRDFMSTSVCVPCSPTEASQAVSTLS